MRNLPTTCPLEKHSQKNSILGPNTTLKMIQDPLLITNATKIWVEIETCQNSSREKKRENLMMVMNLQVIGSKIELGGLTSLLALHVLKTPEMHTYPRHKVLLRYL
jgi:hypothetical protein